MENQSGFGILKTTLAVVFVVFVIAVMFLYAQLPRGPVHHGSCQRNIKEMGTALALYCQDYQGMLPSSAIYGNKNWDESKYIHFATLHGIVPPPTNAKNATLVMLLYPYTKNKDIIWCPRMFYKPRKFLFIDLKDAHLSPPTGLDAQISYYYKAAVDRAWFGGKDANGEWSCRRDSDYKYPADQIVFYENADRHWGGEGKGLTNGVVISVVFMDGHATAKKLINAGNAVGKSNPVIAGEPGWFNFDFKKNKYLTGGRFFDPRNYGDNLPDPQ